jgi:hypothetical protein
MHHVVLLKTNNNIVYNFRVPKGQEKIMTDKKICIDCGKRFDTKIQMDVGVRDDATAVVVCEDCFALLKRRFWNSMKMEINHSNSNIVSQDKQNKE